MYLGLTFFPVPSSVPLSHPERLPTFEAPILGMMAVLLGVEILAGSSPILLIAPVVFAFCTLLPLSKAANAKLLGSWALLIMLTFSADKLASRQAVVIGIAILLGFLLRPKLLRQEWKWAAKSALGSLTKPEVASSSEQAIAYSLKTLKDFASADAAVVLKQLDWVTAEALLCLPANALPHMTTPTIFADVVAQNRCAYYSDYESAPNAASVLLARGIQSLIVIPLHQGDLQGAILLIWYRKVEFSLNLQEFVASFRSSLSTLLHFQDTTHRFDKLQSRFSAMLETVHQGIVFVDESGEEGWVNHTAAIQLGLSPGAVEPIAIAQAMATLRMSADNQQQIAVQGAQFFSQPEAKIRDWEWIFSYPQQRVLSISSTPTRIHDVLGRLWVFDDITQRKQAEAEVQKSKEKVEAVNLALEEANQTLERLASVDGLTQIANRRCFDIYLHREWLRLAREQLPLSLILCDVDFFKLFNDGYGHQAGDVCLQKVAQAISKVVKRPADLVARYGGEEFVVILPNTDGIGAVCVAEEIRSLLRNLKLDHAFSKVSQNVTLSLGIASAVPSHESSPSLLIAAADRALYQAKQQGRDRVILQSQLSLLQQIPSAQVEFNSIGYQQNLDL